MNLEGKIIEIDGIEYKLLMLNSNFSKYKFSKRSLNNLEGVHPDMVWLAKEAIKNSPYDFGITSGLRTAKEQNDLYQKGRSKKGNIVTYCDGYKNKSKHQVKSDGFGHAIDIVIYVNGKVNWSEKYYHSVACHIKEVARKLGIDISWAGDWKSFVELVHFELKK